MQYASAVISDNIVRNFGTQNSRAQAAIFLQATRGALVAKNRVINGSPIIRVTIKPCHTGRHALLGDRDVVH